MTERKFTFFRHCRLIMIMAAILLVCGGCAVYKSEKGVDNLWRRKAVPEFVRGEATQSEVLEALGPPSQVIALGDEVVFYYLRELEKGGGMVLILYNQMDETITYDRAIFFFDQEGVLKDYALSKEKIER